MRLALLVSSLLALGAEVHAQDLRTLDSLVPALMRQHDVPGAALVVVRGRTIIALRGYGYARLSDSARVVPERTIFRVASIAKLFVAASVMQQRERGRVDMGADVNRYLGWRVPERYGAPVTLERLLTHTAGFDERVIGYVAPSLDSIGDLGAHLAANLPRRGWAPGTVVGYSNYGFALAAHVVERVSSKDFGAYARAELFVPLGMTRTWYRAAPESLRADLASGHLCGDSGCRVAPTVYSRPYPAGLAYSTAADMGEFLIAMLGGRGASSRGRALEPASVDEIQRQHFSLSAAVPGISYAFFNQRARNRTLLTHAGNVPGFNNLLVLVPSDTIGFYFVANGGRMSFGAALRDSLLQLLLRPLPAAGQPAVVRTDAGALARFAGSYQHARYAHATIERFPTLFSTAATVSVAGDQLLFNSRAFEPIDSMTFRAVDGDATLAFMRPPNGDLLLAAPMSVFGAELPATFERRAWHDRAYFMNEYVSYLIMTPLLVMFVAWPAAAGIAAWRRRRRGETAPPYEQWSNRTLDAAMFFALLWPIYGFGFVARSVRMLEGASGLVYGVSPGMRAFSLVSWLLAALAIAILAGAVASWRRGWWDVARRSLISIVALAAVLAVAFLVRWNYLPAVF